MEYMYLYMCGPTILDTNFATLEMINVALWNTRNTCTLYIVSVHVSDVNNLGVKFKLVSCIVFE